MYIVNCFSSRIHKANAENRALFDMHDVKSKQW